MVADAGRRLLLVGNLSGILVAWRSTSVGLRFGLVELVVEEAEGVGLVDALLSVKRVCRRGGGGRGRV